MSINQGDINKMEVKDSPIKKQDGAVYSTKNGLTNFHLLEDLSIKSRDGQTLLEIIQKLEDENDDIEDKIQIMKQVIQNQEARIQILERLVNEYVG